MFWTFDTFVVMLSQLSPEVMLAFELFSYLAIILIFIRLFGKSGLYVYMCVALIAANIQVLKPVQYVFFDHPVALGTVLFSTTYLCSDILAEYYGRSRAQKAIWLSFTSFLIWSVFLFITMGYPSVPVEGLSETLLWTQHIQGSMAHLFMPTPALFVAGLLSYLASQIYDVFLYQLIRRLTHERFLWLRNAGSTIISALIDNIIFSVLAWVVFASQPMGWHPLIHTYILGTFFLRVVIALLSTPFIYIAAWAVRAHSRKSENVSV